MIYLFTGNNRFLIREEAAIWKNAFGDKYGHENVIYVSGLEGITLNTLRESILGRSLFSEKRLTIIDGFPFSSEKQFAGATDIENFLLSSLDKIPEDNLVVFLCDSPDKRKASYKAISKASEVKEFSLLGEDAVIAKIQSKYSEVIDYKAIQKLVFLKGGDLKKSISEIEKLSIKSLLPSGNNTITLSDIEAHIIPEFEESVFVFIDTLLTKNVHKIFEEYKNLLQFSNFYAIYQSIIANLRVFLYIEYLKSQQKSPSEIGDILKLGNRQFLIQKKHKANFFDLQELYTGLLELDKNMKFGKLISSDEADLQKEVEREFLKFIQR